MRAPAPIAFAVALCLACLADVAHAHKPSDSYLTVTTGTGQELVTARWDLALRDLEFVVGLDLNQDGDITWGELKARRDAVAGYALSRLSVLAGDGPCAVHVTDLMVTQHSDGGYAVLLLEIDAPGDAAGLTLRYDLLFDVDPTHRGLVRHRHGDASSTHLLTPSRNTVSLTGEPTPWWRALGQFTVEGIWHIWIGFDHVLFLITLLLPAVWRRESRDDETGGEWVHEDRFKPVSRSVLKIVTMFTLAHTVTLWLAVMGWVVLPGRWVEVVIAGSIIVTALNNLRPFLPGRGWVIALSFGLIHGFGFANVLQDLGLTDATLGVALLGFNVGVELGQLAIVAVFLPLAFVLRRTGFYRWAVFYTGSVLVAVIALAWMIERAFNLELVGF